MLTRLTHSAIAFAITVVVYQAYVLLAAPLIEPSAGSQQAARMSSNGNPGEPLPATHKHRELLAAYFPPGHWSLTKPPITAEVGQMMLVIDEISQRSGVDQAAHVRPDDGKLRVKKCAILFFPTGRVTGDPPPLDAVVLEAPQGAVLQMEESYQGGVSSLGHIQSGRLLGDITVRSDMREAGPHDDLHLRTKNIEIQEDLIYTMEQVQMQLGPHRGLGRHLEIRLVAEERSPSRSPGASFGNIESLVVFKEVQATLVPEKLPLEPAATPDIQSSQAPPITITCDGSFRFDFVKQTASFLDDVRLTQIHPEGQLDELQCGEVKIYLASDENASDGSRGKFQVRSIAAIHSAKSPVILNAPSRRASARCERLWIDLLLRQVTFDRYEHHPFADPSDSGPARPREDVSLTYQRNEIRAPFVKYTAPPANSHQRLGDFEAVGRGWFRAITSDKADAEPFDVSWSERMLLRRIDGKPVLSVNGRPILDMVGMGKLWADSLDLYLRESALDGSEEDLLPADIVPDRLFASGQIAIESEQLHGQVTQLEVKFDYAPNSLLLTQPDGNNPHTGRTLGARQGGLRRAYDISGQTLDMLVTVRGKQSEITSIDIDRDVRFSERPSLAADSSAAASGQELQVVGDHLQVRNADSPAAEILLDGRPATIMSDGMQIRTTNLHVFRGTSKAAVNAPGEIEMLVDRDLSGTPLPAPQPANIRWQRSMELDRDRITFSGNVQVQTVDGTLHTRHLVVRLSDAVQFDGAASRRRLEIAELQCHGGANAIFSQRDATGLTSVQTIKLEDSFFANLQNGDLKSLGPGKLESVHLSDAKNPFDNPANLAGQARLANAGAQAPPHAAQQRLKYLGVQFVKGIVGNLHGRRVRVVGDVDAVYGPVDAWEQRLELTKRGMPGPETVWINCQSLEVAESPLAKLQPHRKSGLGPIELKAEGDVTIEGPYGERGNFTTHSREAKYDQLKNTFIIRGDPGKPAKVSTQDYRGGPVSTHLVTNITYFLETRAIRANGVDAGQIRQFTPSR